MLYDSGDQRPWHVFYHFVGAVPGSTELLGLLCRLLYEMKALPVCRVFLVFVQFSDAVG